MVFIQSFREDFIQGFEASIVVLFCQFVQGLHNKSVLSRCKSKAIVICLEEHVHTIIPSNSKCDFANTISLHGIKNNFFKIIFFTSKSKKNIYD
jgi:hypothetical protein